MVSGWATASAIGWLQHNLRLAGLIDLILQQPIHWQIQVRGGLAAGRIDSTGQSRDQHDHESFFPGFLADQSSGGITVLGGIKFGRWLDPRSDARQRDFGDRSNGQLGNLTETRALNLGVPMSLSADLARHASAESAVYPGQNCALLFPQCFRGSQVCTAFLGPQRLLEACFHHARPHLGPGKELPAFERNFRQIFGSFHWDSATPH
jgi:hypothetical protein